MVESPIIKPRSKRNLFASEIDGKNLASGLEDAFKGKKYTKLEMMDFQALIVSGNGPGSSNSIRSQKNDYQFDGKQGQTVATEKKSFRSSSKRWLNVVPNRTSVQWFYTCSYSPRSTR